MLLLRRRSLIPHLKAEDRLDGQKKVDREKEEEKNHYAPYFVGPSKALNRALASVSYYLSTKYYKLVLS